METGIYLGMLQKFQTTHILSLLSIIYHCNFLLLLILLNICSFKTRQLASGLQQFKIQVSNDFFRPQTTLCLIEFGNIWGMIA